MKWLCFRMFFLFGVVLLVVNSQIPASHAAFEVASEEMEQVAREGIISFLGESSPKELTLFGFADTAEVRSATIGEGFEILAAQPKDLKEGQKLESLASITQPAAQWVFVVYASGKPACLITLAQVDGKWAAVSIGGSGLSKELHLLTQSYPKSRGYAYKLVRVYQVRADFVEVYKDSKSQGAVAMISGRIITGNQNDPFDPEKLMQPEKIVDTITPIVREALRNAQ